MVEEQLGARSKPAGSFSLWSFSVFLSASLKSRGLVVAVGWCSYFRVREVQVGAMTDGAGMGQSHVLQTCVSFLQHCRVQGSGCSQTPKSWFL